MTGIPKTAISTYSGQTLDLAEPKAERIRLEDIVAGLSKVCRFGGQSLQFYSVAQHAIGVSLTLKELGHPDDLALAALHHDSHEAYTCDVPKPLKIMLEPCYSKITDALDQEIAKALGIEAPKAESAEAEAIKDADRAVLLLEADELLRNGRADLRLDREVGSHVRQATRRAIGEPPEPWSIEMAHDNFQRHHELLAGDR